MTYIDAFHDRKADKIRVVECDPDTGQHFIRDWDAPSYFYRLDANGRHTSIFGDRVKRVRARSTRELRALIEDAHENGETLFESDINPVFKLLAQEYLTKPAPNLRVGFFDIEVDFDPARGFAPPHDPFSPVTAVSIHDTGLGVLTTLALAPPTMEYEAACDVVKDIPDTYVFSDERDLFEAFFALIEDVHVLSGWNSEGFDIPYMVNRAMRLKFDVSRFCIGGEKPREREFVKFQKTFKTFELAGRVHLDYLLLYQKHNPQQHHSYRLDFIGEIVVGENKVPYEGTLDDLYKKDFRRFILYNRQDTALLEKIDAKKKFIELANQVAHSNGVLLRTTMGSVSLVEQAIINEMHAMGFVVPDRKRELDERFDLSGPEDGDDEDEEESGRPDIGVADGGHVPVVGAYVAKPRVGRHDMLACCDINSLYPSAIRALNMSPETVRGQVRPDATMALVRERMERGIKKADAWEGLFALVEVTKMHERDPNFEVTVEWNDMEATTMTAEQLHDLIFHPDANLCITANGTIFDTSKDGMIPLLLGKWYADRKHMQAEAKRNKELAETEEDATKKAEHKFLAQLYDQRQQARKILLNSLYGALLNVAMRFYDERLGQSTTLTGRSIVKHMNAALNEVLTGSYDHEGAACYYADTDSAYVSAFGLPDFKDFDWTNREAVVELYDAVADQVNATFPDFMARTFNCTLARGGLIKAGRELVASKALFIKKKKYAVLMFDKENERLDVNGKPGKIKAMGLDLKRADTPKYMQQFLEKLLLGILTGEKQDTMYDWIKEFRVEFRSKPGWEKGTPRKVNGLTMYGGRAEKAQKIGFTAQGSGKVNMPGHVRASLNWNRLIALHQDRHALPITDASKVVVCKLKPNTYRMDSVAYPIDEMHLPAWFKELPFDHGAMEDVIVTQKIMNIAGVLNWDMSRTRPDDGLDDLFG